MSHRVLFVDAAQCYGGAQRSLIEVLTHLDHERVKPLLLGAHDSPDGLLHNASQRSVPFEKLTAHSWERSFDGIMQAAKDILKARPIIRDICQQSQIDLIYANGIQAGLLCAIDRPPDVPFVFHHRDVRCPPQALRYAVKRAARTLVGSEYVKRATLEHLDGRNPDAIEVLVNGLDLSSIRDKAEVYDYREHFTIPAEHKLVVLVGDFVEWKRQGLFVEAIEHCIAADPTVHGYIVGGARDTAGFLQEELVYRQIEQAGQIEHVIMTGTMANPYPLMRAADCVVTVADGEPFGRTVVEALAVGTPVVALRGGGPEEIAADQPGVILVDEARPDAISDGILTAFAVSAADRQAAATRMDETYALDLHIERLYQIIQTHAQPGTDSAPADGD